jgi:hypothetical protein
MTDRTTQSDNAPALIERYVREVARRLPPKQRGDVSRELRSSLLDALDDRFGPQASWVQAAVLLREHGSPRTVAASYRPVDYLVGPEWYPAFALVLRVVLAVLAGVLVVGSAITVFTRPASGVGSALVGVVGTSLQGGLIAFALIVGIFHLLQQTEEPFRLVKGWDPEDLPPVRECDVAGRFEAIAGVIAAPVFLALLYIFRDAIGLPVEGGGRPLLNDVFLAYLPWFSAALLAGMAVHAVLVWRGRWSWPTRAAKLTVDLFAVWVLYRVAAGVAARQPELTAAGLPDGFVEVIGWLACGIPAIVAVVTLIELGKVAYCHLRHPPPETV